MTLTFQISLMNDLLRRVSFLISCIDGNVVMLEAQCFGSMLRYKHVCCSVTCYGLNVVLTLLAIKTFFNHGATYGFGREERWICRRGWYLNRQRTENHSFVRLLATHKAKGNDVKTPTFYQLLKQTSHAVITWSIVMDPRNVGSRFVNFVVNFIRDGTVFA